MNMIEQEKDKVEILCRKVNDYNEKIGWIRKLEQERSKLDMLGKRNLDGLRETIKGIKVILDVGRS